MARKKAVMEEITESAEKVATNTYKAWEDRSNEEKQASINEYSKSIIAKAIKEKVEFWSKDKSKEDIDTSIPYNASKGSVYTGLTSALLRAVTELNGYEEPAFLTMKQANFMGGKLKKLTDENGNEMKTKNGKDAYVQGVKIAILKTTDYVPKIDENGEVMTRVVKDKDGNVKLNEKKEPIKEDVMEKVYLQKPVLETITLYHISQFTDLKMEKLQDRDYDNLDKLRDGLRKSEYDIRPNINNLGLSDKTTQDINNFLNSELKGLDYKKIQYKEITQTQEQDKNISRGRGI